MRGSPRPAASARGASSWGRWWRRAGRLHLNAAVYGADGRRLARAEVAELREDSLFSAVDALVRDAGGGGDGHAAGAAGPHRRAHDGLAPRPQGLPGGRAGLSHGRLRAGGGAVRAGGAGGQRVRAGVVPAERGAGLGGGGRVRRRRPRAASGRTGSPRRSSGCCGRAWPFARATRPWRRRCCGSWWPRGRTTWRRGTTWARCCTTAPCGRGGRWRSPARRGSRCVALDPANVSARVHLVHLAALQGRACGRWMPSSAEIERAEPGARGAAPAADAARVRPARRTGAGGDDGGAARAAAARRQRPSRLGRGVAHGGLSERSRGRPAHRGADGGARRATRRAGWWATPPARTCRWRAAAGATRAPRRIPPPPSTPPTPRVPGPFSRPSFPASLPRDEVLRAFRRLAATELPRGRGTGGPVDEERGRFPAARHQYLLGALAVRLGDTAEARRRVDGAGRAGGYDGRRPLRPRTCGTSCGRACWPPRATRRGRCGWWRRDGRGRCRSCS